jgi:hypothetical protein
MSFLSIAMQQFLNSPCVYISSLPTSSIIAANTDPLSMSDIRRVFDGKRVVFAGDAQIRSIYWDMAKLLLTGHLLSSSDVTFQNGEKILSGGKQSACFV